jgi:hypothetical protein
LAPPSTTDQNVSALEATGGRVRFNIGSAFGPCVGEVCSWIFIPPAAGGGGGSHSPNGTIAGFEFDITVDEENVPPFTDDVRFVAYCAILRQEGQGGRYEKCDGDPFLASIDGPLPLHWSLHGLTLTDPKGLMFEVESTGALEPTLHGTGASYWFDGQIYNAW